MSVLRVHRHRRDFTITVNATPRDRRLSARARGVLWFLLSQRDGYPVNAETLATEEFPEGRDAIVKAIKELLAVGYLRRRREQDPRGRWITYTDVYETPEMAAEEPATDDGIPGVGEPGTDNGFSGAGGAAGQTAYPQVAPTTGKPSVGELGAKELRTDTQGQEQGQEPSAPDGAADDPEILDAEIIDPTATPERETAQTVLGAYIDWRRAQGVNGIDKRTTGLLARQLGEAFTAGHPPEVIKRGLWSWHQSAQHPSTLCSFIDADARGGGRGNGRLSDHERRHLASVQELLTAGGAA